MQMTAMHANKVLRHSRNQAPIIPAVLFAHFIGLRPIRSSKDAAICSAGETKTLQAGRMLPRGAETR